MFLISNFQKKCKQGRVMVSSDGMNEYMGREVGGVKGSNSYRAHGGEG